MSVCKCACTYVCSIYVCIYVCVYVCKCQSIYIYICLCVGLYCVCMQLHKYAYVCVHSNILRNPPVKSPSLKQRTPVRRPEFNRSVTAGWIFTGRTP